MIVIDELKLNKFVAVSIPTNKAMFARFGESTPLDNQYSGDVDIPEHQSKIDQIRETDADFHKFLKENPEQES